MSFRFYIDGQLTDQPVNDTALSTSIKRDSQLNALLVTQEANLIWNGNNDLKPGEISGYSYLKNLFDNGICQESTIEIFDQQTPSSTVSIYVGVLKIPQMEVDHQKALLSCKIQDNSFYSYINNNKSLKVNLEARQTKEKTAITPLTKFEVDLFNTTSCVYSSSIGFYYKGFLVKEAFEFVIAALTNNRVTFRSNFLDNLTNPLMIFTGQYLINPYNLFPNAQGTLNVSFDELYIELNKLYNLSFYIDSSDPDNPVFVLEDSQSLFENSTNPFIFSDIKELKQTVDSKRLYSEVKTGDENAVYGDQALLTMPPNVSYFAFQQEQFFPFGQCNTNSSLDLQSSFVIDTNCIMDALVGNNTSLLDKLFFIECNNFDYIARTCEAVQYPLGLLGNCFYNLGLNNFNKMQRHSTSFETAFGNFLGIGSDGFQASLGDLELYSINPNTTGTYIPYTLFPPFNAGVTTEPVIFTDETTGDNYDGNQNYFNLTGVYTVPITGDYSFAFNSDFIISGIVNSPGFGYLIQMSIRINHYNALNVLVNTSESVVLYSNNGDFAQSTTLVTTADATDYVQCAIQVQFIGVAALFNIAFQTTSNFQCNGTPDNGISITTGNSNVKKYLFEFQYNIPYSDFILIQSNPAQLLGFEKDGITRYGWIQDMQRNDWTSETKIKLITNDAITTE